MSAGPILLSVCVTQATARQDVSSQHLVAPVGYMAGAVRAAGSEAALDKGVSFCWKVQEECSHLHGIMVLSGLSELRVG